MMLWCNVDASHLIYLMSFHCHLGSSCVSRRCREMYPKDPKKTSGFRALKKADASASQPWFSRRSVVVSGPRCCCTRCIQCIRCSSIYQCSTNSDSFLGFECGGGLEITTWTALQWCRQRLRPCSAAFWWFAWTQSWWLWWFAQTLWSRHSAGLFQLLGQVLLHIFYIILSCSYCIHIVIYILLISY